MGTGGNKINDPKFVISTTVRLIENALFAYEVETDAHVPHGYRESHPFIRATAAPGTYYLDIGHPGKPRIPRLVLTFSVYDPENKPRKKSSAEKKLEAIETLLKSGPRASEWQEVGLLHVVERIIRDEIGTSSEELKKAMADARKF